MSAPTKHFTTMNENRPVTILIVDDKPANIFALEQLLEKPGRTFINATNGVEALKTALNHDIDLLILDVQMPGMDGFEVAQILKTNHRTRDIPIIFASAEKKEQQFVLKGFEEGGIDYLYKPLDPLLTEARVSVLLRLHLQQKELAAQNAALERYALLINNSADIICTINAETLQFEEVNNAVYRITGYTAAEVRGASLLDFLPEADRPQVEQAAQESGEHFSFETALRTKAGAEKCLHWNIVNRDGRWFANVRDISQQKQTDQEILQLNAHLKRNVAQLEETNKELESFSYTVSHDLRAPLRAINGYTQMIRNEFESGFPDEMKRLFGIIQKNAIRMGDLIHDLLEFSRLGKTPVTKSPVDMNQLVKAVVDELSVNGHSKASIRLEPLAPAEGDYNLLYQVWFNLVANALKYSGKKEQPEIVVGCLEKEHEVVYFVQDNGVGFNMKYAQKLFGVFQRLHGKSEFEGTGVGLATVQKIISRHGGSVWAEAEVNKGATFYFTLPRPEAQP
ncbi:ATP-binding protein [Paraflavisolibacter sp. H34]|uniref:sensor histidine kinase n=1 Tax=Huijunlia imazamoxiresistens TaxID=3127457 RepID=UPI00301A020F